MSTKLTLTIDQKVIRVAKSYANTKGRSLSDLIESYLKALTTSKTGETDWSPKVRRLMGSVRMSEGSNYKETLTKELTEKHSK